MKIIKINQNKQENGLWGIPSNCATMDFVMNVKTNELKFSAIIAALCNQYFNHTLKIFHITDDGFNVTMYDFMDNSRQTFHMKFDNYEVIDDILYEFNDDVEHIRFNRKNKLKKIKNLQKIC
jgi:hypothetical protein